MNLKYVLILLLSVAAPAPLAAQDVPLPLEVPLSGTNEYAEDIPRPKEVIGHQIGTRHTRPHQVVAYFQAVAAASDRVVYEEHGRTYEGRRLIHAVVTAPENQQRLEEIRRANVRLVEQPASVSDADIAEMPAVVYMGYSIHGDEASGTEAAILLLYHLAAGRGPAVEEVLENTVVIIDPLLNPDGSDRFVDWVNGNRGGVHTTDPQDREHDQPWPGGRTNHYWFDLNRDWLPVQQPESQSRVDLFHRWHPQVLADFHEMDRNATYFFKPGVSSRTNPHTPERNGALTAEMATYHAEALDDIGTLYYTRETFDDFYYGKGSTYADINGAIGILFEQASSRALETETNRGTLHYAFTVRNQFITSLSTLEAAVDLREELLRYQRHFYAEQPDSSVEAYVFGKEENRTRAQALAKVLRIHDIDVHELARPLETEGHTFRPGWAYVVPAVQTEGRLLHVLMERTTTLSDSIFYDVSTWTLPLAFDLDIVRMTTDPAPYIGHAIEEVTFDGGQLVGGTSRYAYAMEWGSYFAPRALYRLQQAGIHPRLMTEPFTAEVDGKLHAFGRGAIVIPVQARSSAPDAPVPDSVQALVQRLVEKDHVDIYALQSGLTPIGPDLGSQSAVILEQPEIALITGPYTRERRAGEVWHLLAERFRIPVSLIDTDDVGKVDLARYNTIVMAGGYGNYGNVSAEVRNWVEQGGRLITLASATDWAVENGLVDLEKRDLNLDSLFQDLPYGKLQNAYRAQEIGGSIFRANLDVTHPIAFGYDDTVPLFLQGTTFYDPATEPGANVAIYAENPLISGYISDERLKQARGSAAIVADQVGEGRVILFMNNPNFRAFWYGTNGLFLNAIFFGGVF